VKSVTSAHDGLGDRSRQYQLILIPAAFTSAALIDLLIDEGVELDGDIGIGSAPAFRAAHTSSSAP
jgi:hypothetical protein